MSTRTVAQILASIENTVAEFKAIGFSLEAVQELVIRDVKEAMPGFLDPGHDGLEYHTHHLREHVAQMFNK